ncbi:MULTISPECIES: 50S ribosomal protein L24 [Kocuria]|uniref:Large ribosomal subunit protein uL24 n=1 Tax=Kocuria subflava TaxID=1736139 RepID=A0A846U448_9MICC|nr:MULTISPECIES: 50S ribosomal protein L24 [Kocuria]NKE09541.1 50S ribosomal protein L24 [Kocuria subflava]
MPKFKIKTGDLVQVISGKKDNKGKQGKVLRVIPETERVVVEGVNVVTRHKRATMQGEAGGIEKVEAPIHISNVALVDPETKKPTKVGYRTETVERNGRTKTIRVRVSKSTGKDL